MSDPGAAVPITHRRVLAIAIPIVVSNATVPLAGLVDTGVVGQLGAAAPIGAVGLGALVLTSIYWVFGFLRMGTTGLTSQAFGARDQAEVDRVLARALMIGFGGGLVVFALQVPLFWVVFWAAPASGEVEDLARTYMAIRVLSAPAAIAIYGITGWLIGQERTRAVLAIQVMTNGVNIGLSALFVLVFGWGIEGVAAATVIAEWMGVALALMMCRTALGRPATKDWSAVLNRPALWRMAAVNGDILLRTLLLQAIFLTFTAYGASLGDVELAANHVLLQFLMITAFALDGFAFAAEALVGAALGAKRRDALRRSAVLTVGWGAVIVTGLAAIFALFGGMLIDLLTTAEDVRAQARVYLPWVVAAPLIGCAAWMLDGIFIGATRTREMRNMMGVSLVIYGAAALILVPIFENHGLWAALMVSFVARAVTLGMLYPRLEAGAGQIP
ncbi:MAG: MATE family efflux transporter [Pseudomonadota bacterium]